MYDVITIGTVTVDTFINADFLKTVRDTEHLEKIGFPTGQAECFSLGSKIEIKEPIIEVGGGAHNAAVTFARAGLKTGALFNVGNDKEGDMVIKEIIKKDIRPFEIVDKNKKTGVSYILINKSGERTILVNRGCSGDIENSEVPFKKLESKWAYISPGNIPFSVLKNIFSTLKKNKTKIVINPSKDLIKLGYKKIKSIFEDSSVVIMNREEAAYLTHTPYELTNEIFSKFDKYVPGIAVMTDGKKGALVSDGRLIYESGVYKEKKVADRTGAGDSFGSGFAVGLIESNEQCQRGACSPHKIIYSLRRAAANATANIEEIGAATGVLSTEEFNKQRRWKNLSIETRKIFN